MPAARGRRADHSASRRHGRQAVAALQMNIHITKGCAPRCAHIKEQLYWGCRAFRGDMAYRSCSTSVCSTSEV